MSTNGKSGTGVRRNTDVCANPLHIPRAVLQSYRAAMAGVVRSEGVRGTHVEDVVHDAFEMACRKPELERPDPTHEAKFGGWLCALARFAAMTARNDTVRNREIPASSEALEGASDGYSAYVSRADDRVALSAVLESLSEDEGVLLHEHFCEEKTVQELAEERGIPWTTMRSRIDGVLERARHVMREPACRSFRRIGTIVLAWIGLGADEALACALRVVRAHTLSSTRPIRFAAGFGFALGVMFYGSNNAADVPSAKASAHNTVSASAMHADQLDVRAELLQKTVHIDESSPLPAAVPEKPSAQPARAANPTRVSTTNCDDPIRAPRSLGAITVSRGHRRD